jgi:hypothetical protein
MLGILQTLFGENNVIKVMRKEKIRIILKYILPYATMGVGIIGV